MSRTKIIIDQSIYNSEFYCVVETSNAACTTDVGGPLVRPTGLVGIASQTTCNGGKPVSLFFIFFQYFFMIEKFHILRTSFMNKPKLQFNKKIINLIKIF